MSDAPSRERTRPRMIRCSMASLKEQDMKRAMLTVVAVSAVVVIGLAAQAPPNLAGTWRPQNPNAGQVTPFEFTIAQTADSVTIKTPLSNPDSVTMGQRRRTSGYPA